MSDQDQTHFTRQRVRERRESLRLQQEALVEQQRRIAAELAETDPGNEWREEDNSGDQRRPATSKRTTNRGRGRGRAPNRGRAKPPSRGRAKSAIAREVASAGRDDLLPSESFDDHNVSNLVEHGEGTRASGRRTRDQAQEGGDDDVFEQGTRTSQSGPSRARGAAIANGPENGASSVLQHPRLMSGSPVTQTTYTARQLDDMISERIQERDAEWTAFQNDQLQARANELMELRSENEALKRQMEEALARLEEPTEEDPPARNHSLTTEDDEELALSRRQVSPVESESSGLEGEDAVDGEEEGEENSEEDDDGDDYEVEDDGVVDDVGNVQVRKVSVGSQVSPNQVAVVKSVNSNRGVKQVNRHPVYGYPTSGSSDYPAAYDRARRKGSDSGVTTGRVRIYAPEGTRTKSLSISHPPSMNEKKPKKSVTKPEEERKEKPHLPPAVIPPYNGKKACDDWIEVVEKQVKAYKWNEDILKSALAGALTPNVKNYLRSYGVGEDDDFATVKKALMKRYGAHRNIETIQQKFHLLQQSPGETAEEYFDKLMYKRMSGWPKESKEERDRHCIQRFLCTAEDRKLCDNLEMKRRDRMAEGKRYNQQQFRELMVQHLSQDEVYNYERLRTEYQRIHQPGEFTSKLSLPREQHNLINPNYGYSGYQNRNFNYENSARRFSDSYQRPEYRSNYRPSTFRNRNDYENRSSSQSTYCSWDRNRGNSTTTSAQDTTEETTTANQIQSKVELNDTKRPDYSKMKCYGCGGPHPVSKCTERQELYKNASKEFRRRENEKKAPITPENKMPAWKENLVSMIGGL